MLMKSPRTADTSGVKEVQDGHTVLAADDDPDILQLASVRPQRAAYEVLTAPDREEALELVRKHHPDLAVLDAMMLKLDGLEVTVRFAPTTT